MSSVTTNSSNNNNNKEESQENEFTAASALACLAKDQAEEKKDGEEHDNENDSNENDNENENDNDDNEEEFLIPQRFTKSGRKRAVPFTIKLMKVLSDKKNAHIITWMPSGKSFNILKPKAFVADILPQHFKTAKYSSFTRKLHRWGFMRHYRGEEAGAFYHKDFQRGRLDLVEEMTCHKAEPPKSTAAMAAAAAAAAPTSSTATAETPKAAPVVVKPVAVRPAATTVPPKKVLPAIGAATPNVSTLNMPTNLVKVSNSSLVGPSAVTAAALPSMTNAANTSNPSAAAVAALESERLNAAIEREVNRRLKERINAVALSRQAFAVSALRQQQLAAMSTHSHSATAAAHSNLTAAILLQKQADLLKNTSSLPLGIAQLGYRALASPEGQPLPSAPPTNIQGARTA